MRSSASSSVSQSLGATNCPSSIAAEARDLSIRREAEIAVGEAEIPAQGLLGLGEEIASTFESNRRVAFHRQLGWDAPGDPPVLEGSLRGGSENLPSWGAEGKLDRGRAVDKPLGTCPEGLLGQLAKDVGDPLDLRGVSDRDRLPLAPGPGDPQHSGLSGHVVLAGLMRDRTDRRKRPWDRPLHASGTRRRSRATRVADNRS